MSKTFLYPLKFIPILKEKIWGGSKLTGILNKQGSGTLGESWEISGVPSNISVVSNGSLTGKSLKELIDNYTSELLGEKVFKTFGTDFPLLFKFIDAADDLSVQLHPDDRLAKERHDSFGKTEMWYVVQADEGSRLILGFNREMDEATYLSHLESGSITDILKEVPVKEGESYFIAPGTVHAIGGGILLAEIQQTSDITYRIYDWDRPGLDGNMRELHTSEAMDAIDYGLSDAQLHYSEGTDEVMEICDHPFFHTSRLYLTANFNRELKNIDSFVVYMCLKGAFDIDDGKTQVSLKAGETVLIPAQFDQVQLLTNGCDLLEVYIP